ncbi:MAG TPA: alkaline phosphatase family protein, partial [Thermomicrobiaceae bacterium]|nr:alkaline phosphatase family protein [Thermomicrobiaceae bacterium]
DNAYVDAEVSAQGHNWTTAAMSNDYTEKNWMAKYSGRNRGYDFEGTNTATYPPAGFLWDDAARAGVSFRDYGEFASYRAATGRWVPNDPSLSSRFDSNYPGWGLGISDLTRVAAWRQEFDQFVQHGNLPALEIVRLPNDHTAGNRPGSLTPQAMVAQNDQAVGELVDAVSHSPYWKDTAIVITEDDAQGGPDHVDAHRTETLVISPYTQRGVVDHTYYDTASLVRTIELLLGLQPMTQFDAAATPMYAAFGTRPDLAPYTALGPRVGLSGINTPVTPGAASRATTHTSPVAGSN